MENFNIIPNAGTYGSAIALINANFQLTKEQLERLAYSREGFCGMYETDDDLEAAYPHPTTGSFAYVGTSFPMTVYLATNGVWAASSSTYSGGGIDLTQYALDADLESLADRVAALEGAGYVFIGVATPNGVPTVTTKSFALAWAAGTYTNYGGYTVNAGELAVLLYNGSSWSGIKTDIVAKGVVGGYDTTPTEDSEKPVTSGGVYEALDDLRDDVEDMLANADAEFGTGEKVSDTLIRLALGSRDDVLLTQKTVSNAIFNEININDIDDLNTLAYQLAPSDSRSLKPTFYTVVATRGALTYRVGSMAVFSDNLGHVVTEVMTTHYLLDASGNLTSSSSDSELFSIYRSVNPSVGTWTTWHYVNSSIWTSAINSVRTDLTNYYTKLQTYSKTEVDNLIAAINQFEYIVANSLPYPSASTMRKIYLIPSAHSVTQNVKDEYITIWDGNVYKWEQIGSTAVDLSGYSTKAEMNTAINAAIASALISYYTKTEVNTLLNGKQNVIDDLATIRSGAAAGATAVQPAAMNSAISSAVSTESAHIRASIGYYECSTAAATAAKVISASGYTLTNGGCIRIKMMNGNTANNVTLNINSTGAKALYYDGAQASSANTWEAGEVLEVYYDGTQYQCVSGGGKFATGESVDDVAITNSYDLGGDDDLLTKEALSEVLYGEPVENTGTWGNWRHSSTLERIFIISDQLSVLGGVISVSLNDYSTYRLGIVIQQGTEWTSTVISDTGWKTADTTKVIAANEVGYNIKVSLSRIDNGTINPSDANTIIRSLSYTYMSGGSSGVMRSIDDIYAKMGYYVCETASATSAKIVSADGYKLATGGNIRIKMSNDNTADNVTLNINGTGTKALYYNDAQATASNSWNAGEVLEVYYDGTQYQSMSISKLQRDIDVLDDAVFGVPTEQTGTWGAWQSAVSPPNNVQRIFTICNQRAVKNGIVIVSLNDYTTYKFGIVIANGVTWSSTTITDTGWLTRDTTKTISQSEDGYYLRIALARVDNGAISPSDAASIIRQLSYTFVEGTEGIMSNYTRIGTFANTSNLPCSSSNTSKLTVECTSENNYKVTCISKQALVYGYIGLPSSLEAGKKYRMMFHCISDNYNSASIALSNSNGSTSMIVSNVQKMDGDFVLDFVYETNSSYLRFFCNDMQTGSSIIIENLRIVPTESLNAVQEVVNETIPQSSFVYASTRKLDFTNKHRNIYPCSYSHPSWTLPSAQCLAIYNNYFIRIAADDKLTISQLSNDTMTTIYTSEQNLAGHNNSAQFAPFLQQGQTFPYLYVSALNRTGGPICKVYEITTSSVTLVQTITFNLPETILPTMSSYSANSQIGDDGCLYIFSTEIGVVKLITPNVSAGDVVLGLESVLDYFRFAYDYNTFVWQGGKIYNGMLIMPIGGWYASHVSSIFVFDLAEHKVIATIGANTAWSTEVEDCDLLDGKLCTVSATGNEVTIWDFDG